MNQNINLQCQVCGDVVRLKIYAGYELKNPFSYSCPECGISITGELEWNDNLEKGFFKEFNCNNAKFIEEMGSESHLLQVATEFYTDKIKKMIPDDPTIYFSPFMMDTSTFEQKQKKVSLIKYTIENFKENYKHSMRIWDLYRNKKNKYLNRQLLLHDYVQPVLMGQVLKINYDEIIKDVIYRPFSVLLVENQYNKKIKNLRSLLNDIGQKNTDEIKCLSQELQDSLLEYEENLIHLLQNFASYYSYIWPIILSSTYQTENINLIKEKQGILTTNFDNLKNYYVESFELLTSILPIFLGIQNTKLRKNRNRFEENISKKFPSIQSILDYDNKVVNKGNKIKYFEDENIFSNFYIIDDVLNNIIRNSIGHYSYEYVSDKQLIKFKDKNKNIDLYLIEFGELLFKTFFATLITLETVWFVKNFN